VLEQSACDDPGMDKIMVCAGFSPRMTRRRVPPGLREATATGKQEPATTGRTTQIGHTSRSPA